MGTQILGSQTPNTTNGASWGFSGENVMGGGTFTMPQDGYIDSIAVWCASLSGPTTAMTHVLWDAGTLNVIASTGTNSFNTTFAYKQQSFTAGSYVFLASGRQFHTGISAGANGIKFQLFPSGNNFAKTGTSGPVGMSGATQNQFSVGDTNSWVSYFPVATLTSISPTVGGAGTTVTLTGRSYSAGVTGVSFNGTPASSFNYINDTTVTAVVPSGATSGTITITTHAGNATSASSFTVAGAYVMRSGVWTPTQGVFVMRSGVWTQVTGVFVMRSGTWTPTG
ncbi:MAG: IPT/TIG domain-containing protein [Ktedonobacterales bacterium]